MSPRRLDLDDLASVLPRNGRVLVGGCSGESLVLAQALMGAGPRLGALTFTGIFIPGVNKQTYLANPECRVETFFLTPELKAAGGNVKFLPLCYTDILARLREIPLDAAIFMATPPDAEGLCGFGPVADFLVEVWERIPIRIAHINPRLPRVASSHAIPFDALTAYVEADQELLSFAEGPPDDVSSQIGEHVARFIPDGSTIQVGLGKIANATLLALRGRRGLRLHSGLIPEGVVDLEDAGALAPGLSVNGGVAIGSRRLYDRVGGAVYRFDGVCTSHDPRSTSKLERAVGINSALEVDLFGQAYAEFGPSGLMSGPGGACDFARGIWVAGGLRIVALSASAARGKISRIIAPGTSPGPVSLGRMDTDIVVTEYGAADLRGLDHEGRALALIKIAPPDHRERLREAWSALSSKF